jgi:hypothetical protein
MSETIMKPIVPAESQVKQSNLMSFGSQNAMMSFRDNNNNNQLMENSSINHLDESLCSSLEVSLHNLNNLDLFN